MLYVYTGPMYAGKTTKLLTVLYKYSLQNYKMVKITHESDVRECEYTSEFTTSHNKDLSDNIQNLELVKLNHLKSFDISNYDIIGIDEAQWFSDLYETISLWVKMNKLIICVGLDGDFNQNMFGDLYKLLPLSSKFKKLSSICNGCSGKGSFTLLKNTEDCKKAENSKLVGGKDIYQSYCRICLNENFQ